MLIYCNTYCSSALKIVTRTRLNINLYVHFLYYFICKEWVIS